jgi:hypothetical protein
MNNQLTNFPSGVSSFGIPVLPYSNLIHVGSTVDNGTTNIQGDTHWWVNGSTGSDGNDGMSPSTPKLTMDAVFDRLNSGDIIHVNGNITEQLTTPAGIFDVTIIGEGNLPRNADAHTGDNGYTSATWKYPSSPTASTPLLKIQQQGWRIVNMLFSGSLSSTPDVLLFRDGGAGDAERDASHAQIIGCRFDGGVTAIQDSGGCAFVQIQNNLFRGFTGDAINNVTGAGIGTLLCWNITGNRFFGNESHIDLTLSAANIWGNTMGDFTTDSINLSGGVGNNVVTQNYLSGTYSAVGGYTRAAATDQWAGNITPDAGVATAPWTLADPA